VKRKMKCRSKSPREQSGRPGKKKEAAQSFCLTEGKSDKGRHTVKKKTLIWVDINAREKKKNREKRVLDRRGRESGKVPCIRQLG